MMKRLWIRSAILACTGLLLVALSANGQGYDVTYLEKTPDSSILEIRLTSYTLHPLPGMEGWVIPQVQGGVALPQKGAPELPFLNVPLATNSPKGVSYRILQTEEEVLENVRVAPSLGVVLRDQLPSKMRRKEGAIYSEDALFPLERVTLSEVYAYHDARGQNLNFSPFQYNPVTRELRVARRIVLVVNRLEPQWTATLTQGLRLKGRALNATSPALQFANRGLRSVHEVERGRMLIVTRAKFLTTLAPFIHWKQMRGVPVEVVLYSDIHEGLKTVNDTTALKSLLSDRYSSPEGLKYLLLVGSRTDVPPLRRMGAMSMSDSDQAYGQLVGTDSYNEVYVGRFSARTAEDLKTQIDRTIWYERDVQTDANWLSTALNIASSEGNGVGDNGESDREHMRLIAKLLQRKGYTKVDSLYEKGSSDDITPEQVSSVVNGGVGLINYVGHGFPTQWKTTGFSVEHINSLTNQHSYPFIFDVACDNGKMEANPCFAEAWMWANGGGGITGALAICASSDQQDWMCPMRAQDAMVEYLTGELSPSLRTYGAITTYGMARMLDKYSAYYLVKATVHTWNVFGDPSVVLRTKAPEAMPVDFSPIIPASATEYTIGCNVPDSDATLCITTPTGERAYYYSTVKDGTARFVGLSLIPGATAELAVWNINRKTFYNDQIAITGQDAYWLTFQSMGIQPIATGHPHIAQVGDTWGVWAEVCYKGKTLPGDDLSLRLTSVPESAITVLGADEQDIPTFTSQECNARSELFQIKINKLPGNDRSIILRLEGRRKGEIIGYGSYSFKVLAPDIRIDSIRMVADQNADGILTAGEDCTLALWVSNPGEMDAKEVILRTLWEGSEKASEESQPLGVIQSGGSQRFDIPLVFPHDAADGSIMPLSLEISYEKGEPVSEKIAFIANHDFTKHARWVSHFPLGERGVWQVTQMLLHPHELGATPRRLMAVRFPIYTEGKDTLELSELHLTLSHTAEKEYSNLPLVPCETLFTQAASKQKFGVTNGYITVPIEPFDYNGTSPIVMTLASSNLPETGRYCMPTKRTKSAQTGLHTSHDGKIFNEMHLHYRPIFELIEAQEVNLIVRCRDEAGHSAQGITLSLGSATQKSNAYGEVIMLTKEGRYTASIHSEFYADTTLSVLVRGKPSIVECTLRKAPPEQVLVQIHSPEGIGVGGATLIAGQQSQTADAQGELLLRLSPGDYPITILADGFYNQTSLLMIRKGGKPHPFVLKPIPAQITHGNANIAVWPNPVQDVLQVRIASPIARVKVFNSQGIEVLHLNANTEEAEIPMGSLPAGFYIVELLSTAGDKHRTRIIKE